MERDESAVKSLAADAEDSRTQIHSTTRASRVNHQLEALRRRKHLPRHSTTTTATATTTATTTTTTTGRQAGSAGNYLHPPLGMLHPPPH